MAQPQEPVRPRAACLKSRRNLVSSRPVTDCDIHYQHAGKNLIFTEIADVNSHHAHCELAHPAMSDTAFVVNW
jgi:hypothetical protein